MTAETGCGDVPPVLSALVAIRLLIGICAFWSTVLGLSILATAEERWPPDPRFATALKVPGAPESWGLFILACGLVTAVGLALHRRRTQIAGLLASGAWCISIGIAYIVEFVGHAAGDAGAPVGYMIASMFYLVLACALLPRRKGLCL